MEVGMRYCNKILLLLALIVLFCNKAQAFTCYSDGVSSGDNKSITFTKFITVSPDAFNKSVNDITLTDMSSYAKCSGGYGPTWKDSLRTVKLTLANELVDHGYEGYISSYGSSPQVTPPELCLWPDQYCTVNQWDNSATRALNTIISMKRSEGSGRWSSGVKISAGMEVARLETRMSSMNTPRADVVWIFKLQNDLNLSAYTCTIDHYNASVTLPKVHRSEIMSHGIGRYSGEKKDFKIDLTCDPQTTVSIKFDGPQFGSTTNVLKNTLTGNDNVGVQILFDDEPMDILSASNPIKIISNSQSKETLSFNAWYYYGGGDVSAGAIKSHATFTFDYY